jgi:hypothetical protein
MSASLLLSLSCPCTLVRYPGISSRVLGTKTVFSSLPMVFCWVCCSSVSLHGSGRCSVLDSRHILVVFGCSLSELPASWSDRSCAFPDRNPSLVPLLALVLTTSHARSSCHALARILVRSLHGRNVLLRTTGDGREARSVITHFSTFSLST